MANQSQFCQNCNQNIAANNYALHIVHCEKYIQLCNLCNEPFRKREKEQHLEEYHSIETCKLWGKLCNTRKEKWLMAKHEYLAMNMAAYELFSEADLEQCPCEFCGEPFPFEILVEHQSGCRPDIARYNFDKVVDSDESSDEDINIQEVIAEVSPPKQVQPIETDKSSTQMTEPKATDFKDLVKVAKESIKESVKINEEKQKSPPSKEFKKLSVEDPIMQETGIKLMTYGSNTNKSKQIENEKPSFKVPSIALLNNADQKEVDEGCNSISDDEEGESLEDFWKRAEIVNYQRLKKMKAVNAV